jgi:protein O-GlcNAc transferase
MLVQFEHGGVPVSLEGFDGDHITRVIERTRDFFEAEVLEYIGDLNPTGTIVDIGAFIGNHSVYFGLFTGADEVLAIEPNPAALELLGKNINSNGLGGKTKIIACALGASAGSVGLREGRSSNRGHTLVTGGTETKLQTLDDTVGGRKVSVLKIDVEGYESEVLRGATKLLTDQTPVVLAEARTRKRKRLLDERLAGHGYRPDVSFNHRTWVHSYKK